ncbi:MAG: tRNA (guanine10-N2)-dimethyltransferase [Candidatus Methanomethylophilaceae archaeon]|nr:tRNA (guanine10-N2)-dimethyltransferase [Candidatus Methanomethylophilaceae archaeon]MDI3542306.1 tRNA (guanine10-N2)-dimethyltransferase [Candidatus Methanomethylophilaceae archaeon]HIJ00023.1 methyltransferase domain-containing protein [Candidatus Methanomethylophilaceae archaeon]
MDPFLFELSGEHPSMPLAEALTLISIHSPLRMIEIGPGYLVSEMERGALDTIAERVALTHRIGCHLFTCHPSELLIRAKRIRLPEGTFSIRLKRFGGSMPSIQPNDIIRKLGAIFASSNKVDLENPSLEVRVFVSDRISVHIVEKTIDRASMDSRKVALRPYFSPISLHPRYARALVNLTGAKKGERVLDPFCGTGGILLEAADMGLIPIASDISKDMVDGCRENLEHFGYELYEDAVCDVADIADIFGKVDAVVTDPPYGRSTSTGGEPLDELYTRALSASHRVLNCGGSIGIALPHEMSKTKGFRDQYHFSQKVHRSLTRHYHVLRKK